MSVGRGHLLSLDAVVAEALRLASWPARRPLAPGFRLLRVQRFPSRLAAGVKEVGVWVRGRVRFVGIDDGPAVYDVGSGTHSFPLRWGAG